jgi:osmoprotectant transport system permease protein
MNWLVLNWQQVVELAGAHALLALPAIAISIVLATPIGLLAQRRPRVGAPVLGTATLLYAIPALPFLIIIPALTGLPLRSTATMTIALTVYGVALFARTAADAFGSVDATVRSAATAIGYSPRALFWQVDLPLATPVLVSGARVVVVSTVGLVTIGALIGVSSLGTLLTDGFQRGIPGEVITGIAATVLLALLADAAVVGVGRALTPWSDAKLNPRRVATK